MNRVPLFERDKFRDTLKSFRHSPVLQWVVCFFKLSLQNDDLSQRVTI